MLFSQHIDTRAYAKQTVTWKHYLLSDELFKQLLLNTTFNGLFDYSVLELRNFKKKRAINDCSLYGENHSILMNVLSFNGNALQDILSRMLYIGFCFEAWFLRHLSITFWISKQQCFIMSNQPCSPPYPVQSKSCFWTTN